MRPAFCWRQQPAAVLVVDTRGKDVKAFIGVHQPRGRQRHEVRCNLAIATPPKSRQLCLRVA